MLGLRPGISELSRWFFPRSSTCFRYSDGAGGEGRGHRASRRQTEAEEVLLVGGFCCLWKSQGRSFFPPSILDEAPERCHPDGALSGAPEPARRVGGAQAEQMPDDQEMDKGAQNQ